MRLLTIILAIQLSTSGLLFAEVVKVVNLIEHYRMHNRGPEGMALLSFIRLHYFDTRHEQSDPVKHSQLPLHQTNTVQYSVYLQTLETIRLPEPALGSAPEQHPRNSSHRSRSAEITIFQPPRPHC